MLTDRQFVRWTFRAMGLCGLLGGIIGWFSYEVEPDQ